MFPALAWRLSLLVMYPTPAADAKLRNWLRLPSSRM